MSALDLSLVRDQMKDPNPQMRIQAIRASETLYKAGHRSLLDDYRAATKDADTDVVIQGMLTLSLFKAPDLSATVKATQTANQARGVQMVGTLILQPAMVLTSGGGRGGTPEQQAALQRGATTYGELCSICHGPDGRGTPGETWRRDEGAVTGRVAPRAGASGLRDQSHSARLDRANRRTDVHGRDGADGHEPG